MSALVLSATIPLVGVVVYNFINASDAALSAAEREVAHQAADVANGFTVTLRTNERSLASLSSQDDIRQPEGPDCRALRRAYDIAFAGFNWLAFYDTAGSLVCGTSNKSIPYHVDASVWFGGDGEGLHLSDTMRDPDSGQWTMMLSYPVRDRSGHQLGFLVLQEDALTLQQRLISSSVPSTVIALFDGQRRYAARSLDSQQWVGKMASRASLLSRSGAGNPVGVDRRVGIDGVARIYAYHTIPGFGWMASAGVAESEVFAPYRAQLRDEIVIALAASLLATVLALRASGSVLRPIRHLHRTVTRIEKGDTSARVNTTGTKEVEDVASAVNRMLDVRDLAEQQRVLAETRFQSIFDHARDAIVTVDEFDLIHQINPAAEKMFAVSASEICGQPLSRIVDESSMHEGAIVPKDSVIQARAAEGGEKVITATRSDNSTFPVETSISEVDTHGVKLRVFIMRDVTERVESARRERRQANFYSALSQTNQAIVRMTSAEELYKEICRVIVAYGHASMAYVALVEDGELVPFVWSGPAEQFLQGIELPLGDASALSNGPMATAYREGRSYISNDFLNDPNTIPWRPNALKIGTRSTAAFPIHRAGAVVGVLSVHVTEVNYFTTQLIDLLEEMAGDVSFALNNFDRERLRFQAEAASREASERFEKIVSGAPEAIAVFTIDTGEMVLVNDAFCETFGFSRDEVLGSTWDNIPVLSELACRETLCASLAEQKMVRSIDAQVHNKANALLDVLYSAELIELAGQSQLLLMFSDITERKRAQAQVEYLATHDSLTDLPNRSLIRQRIEAEMREAEQSGAQFALMYLDLDRFKIINDSFGHPFGDRVLRAAGERIRSLLRAQDVVARHGGDEFLVFLPGQQGAENAFAVARKLLDAFEEPLSFLERKVFISMSIGVSHYPNHGTDIDTLIEHADDAMYRAKEKGRKTYQEFSAEISAHTRRQSDLETSLRSAVSGNQLRLVYQPKLDLASGRISGCEALLRWSHPTLGEVRPDVFIPIAEESGLIIPIGSWVLENACRQSKAWQMRGLPNIPISVNISARQFSQPNLVESILGTIKECGLEPDLLELELTESLIADDAEKVIRTIQQLKAEGVRLSIDDFGTGYSSLSQLRRLPVDTLKIDQSFVRNILTDHDDATIAIAIIDLAHNLRLRVIAEGVESAEQLAFFDEHGCDEIQGYHFGRPVEATAFSEFVLAYQQQLLIPS
jgi:diguanylate cyclase (GGDEF)-like protein/PAS domain S-box-containing protein